MESILHRRAEQQLDLQPQHDHGNHERQSQHDRLDQPDLKLKLEQHLQFTVVDFEHELQHDAAHLKPEHRFDLLEFHHSELEHELPDVDLAVEHDRHVDQRLSKHVVDLHHSGQWYRLDVEQLSVEHAELEQHGKHDFSEHQPDGSDLHAVEHHRCEQQFVEHDGSHGFHRHQYDQICRPREQLEFRHLLSHHRMAAEQH